MTPTTMPDPTETPVPAATPEILIITPAADEPQCSLPSDIEITMVDAVSEPSFCIVWVDQFEGELGFRIRLEYGQSGETFVYEVGPEVTQLIVPVAHTPRLNESAEQCLGRKDFQISVAAIPPSPNSVWRVGGMAANVECDPSLPTATPSP